MNLIKKFINLLFNCNSIYLLDDVKPLLFLYVKDRKNREMVYYFAKLLGVNILDSPLENYTNKKTLEIWLDNDIPTFDYGLWECIVPTKIKKRYEIDFEQFYRLLKNDAELCGLLNNAIKLSYNDVSSKFKLNTELYIYLHNCIGEGNKLIYYPYGNSDFQYMNTFESKQLDKNIFVYSSDNSTYLFEIFQNKNIETYILYENEGTLIKASNIKHFNNQYFLHFNSLFEQKDIHYGESVICDIEIRNKNNLIKKTKMIYVISQYEPFYEYYIKPKNIKFNYENKKMKK